MPFIPRFLSSSKRTGDMPPGKKSQPKRRLERCNAVKNFDYDASSSSSSVESSVLTRSRDFEELNSFRVVGNDGEVDRICRGLGLCPDDFAIPEAAWEAMKMRSASGTSSEIVEVEREIDSEIDDGVVVGELGDRFRDRVRVREATDLISIESAESNHAVVTGGGGGIRGIRPPSLKPPQAVRPTVVERLGSTSNISRDRRRFNSSSPDEDVEEEQEESGLRIGEADALSDSCSFTTSNDGDCSSTTTISPSGRFRPDITNWTKGELLGQGSFGSVYEGLSSHGLFFAVKEVSLLDQGGQGRERIFQLEQEIHFLSHFEHENIVQYYGTEKCESKLYIFLELVNRGSLQQLYKKYSLGDPLVSGYTRQILQGLKYLHDQDVLHRDIKCANILVAANGMNGSVKLADFGLAKSTKLNDVKSCKGTAFWMAPEVVRGNVQNYGLPADIWSLGCTVLEMLTRQFPYPHLNFAQAIYQIGKGVPPTIPNTLSRVSQHFISQCLQVNPHDRPTADQLLSHPFVRMSHSTSSGSTIPCIG